MLVALFVKFLREAHSLNYDTLSYSPRRSRQIKRKISVPLCLCVELFFSARYIKSSQLPHQNPANCHIKNRPTVTSKFSQLSHQELTIHDQLHDNYMFNTHLKNQISPLFQPFASALALFLFLYSFFLLFYLLLFSNSNPVFLCWSTAWLWDMHKASPNDYWRPDRYG